MALKEWRMLGVYDSIEDIKGSATAPSVSNGHCFAIRLNGEQFESVDNGGRVCSYLQTDKGNFGFEEYDFESNTYVALMLYMHEASEFKKK